MKILLLEDDEILNEIIEEFLLSLGFGVDSCFDGESAQESIFSKKYDLLVLDVNVPSIDGFSLVKNLRECSILTPAIFITSLNTTKDLERGFAVGGDDYIKKPFELDELKIRINNIKRVHKIDDSSSLEIFEGVAFDPKNFSLGGVKISQKESKILEFFLKKRDEVVSNEELLSNVWSYEDAPSATTLRTYIKNLRKVLGSEAIETIKGIGYRLNS